MLSGKEIRIRLSYRRGDPKKWLVITPVLDRSAQLKDHNASLDLRLGNLFVVPNRAQLEKLDPRDPSYVSHKRLYMDKVVVPMGRHFVLHPRQFVLGQTLEWVHLPPDLGAYVIGRSRWGRDGLIIATATGVHPGWSGLLTLELSNVGELPILLYPGLRYVQLFLHAIEAPYKGTGGSLSQFAGTTKPTGQPHGTEDTNDLQILSGWSPRPS